MITNEDDVLGLEYEIDMVSVDSYLAVDGDISQIVLVDPMTLAKKTANGELSPYKVYLSNVRINREAGPEIVDRPVLEAGVYSATILGDNPTQFEHTQITLEWSSYYEEWLVRVVEAEQGIVVSDTEDSIRHPIFDQAWWVYCQAVCKNQDSRVAELMSRMLIEKPAKFKHKVYVKQEPEVKAVPAPDRPRTFGTWS